MQAMPVDINWHEELPIFASEFYLRGVSDEYGWLGGFNNSGVLRCILPYTIIKKAIFRIVRFRIQTIPVDDGFTIGEERVFLNKAMDFFRGIGADLVMPATTNTLFRTFPDGSVAAPYGSYVIDLSQEEDQLWGNMSKTLKQNINTARKHCVQIIEGFTDLYKTYSLIRETFGRSKLPFMDYESFKRFVLELGDYGKLLTAEYNGMPQTYSVFAYSKYSAYAIYTGNIENQYQGSNKLLYWEAIKMFKKLGCKSYDFVGARINPDPGSKQEALDLFKKRYGGQLKQGYMWKYPLNKMKYHLYGIAAQLRSGGDIVNAEKHKLKGYSPII